MSTRECNEYSHNGQKMHMPKLCEYNKEYKNNILVIVFNWNHFEMRLLNLRINFLFIADFCPHLGIFLYIFCVCCFFFHYVSAKLHLWPSSGDLPRPRIGMTSLVTVSPVITAFDSCCLKKKQKNYQDEDKSPQKKKINSHKNSSSNILRDEKFQYPRK